MSQPPPGPKDYSWQPQPGNYNSAPSYDRPPRKSRAGLVLALIVILVLVALGAVGLLAYRLVSGHQDTSSSPGPTSSIAPPPQPSSTRPSSTRPSSRPTATQPTATRPTLPPRKTPAGPDPARLSGT